jgi:hypothetical protein
MMKKFQYFGMDSMEGPCSGTIEAADMADAFNQLTQQEIHPRIMVDVTDGREGLAAYAGEERRISGNRGRRTGQNRRNSQFHYEHPDRRSCHRRQEGDRRGGGKDR